MQTIQLLGIRLKDHSKWESLGIAERFLKNRALRLVLYVNSKELTLASKDAGLKQFIEQADLTLWSTTELVQVAGLKNAGRHREVENREFLKSPFSPQNLPLFNHKTFRFSPQNLPLFLT